VRRQFEVLFGLIWGFFVKVVLVLFFPKLENKGLKGDFVFLYSHTNIEIDTEFYKCYIWIPFLFTGSFTSGTLAWIGIFFFHCSSCSVHEIS